MMMGDENSWKENQLCSQNKEANKDERNQEEDKVSMQRKDGAKISSTSSLDP